MSSSHFEVRESENDILGFDITCESDDIQPNFNGDPPKDHTYNKDPVICEEKSNNSSEDKKSSEDGDASMRSQRNIKHKFIKTHDEEDNPLPKSPSKKANLKQKNSKKDEDEPTAMAEAENSPPLSTSTSKNAEVSEDISLLQPSTSKKGARKRKAETHEEQDISSISSRQKRQTVTTPEKKPKLESTEDEVIHTEKTEVNGPSKKSSPTKKSKRKKSHKRKHEVEDVKSEKPSKKVKKEESPERGKKNKETKTVKSKNIKSEDFKKPVNGNEGLPKGWRREVVIRKSGKTAGLRDIYIYSPEGLKFRSRPDVASYLAKIKSNLRIEDFDFTRGVPSKTPVTSNIKKESSSKEKAINVKKEKAIKVKKEKAQKTSSKKKTLSETPKKGQKLLVKLNFTPPKKSNRDQKDKPATSSKDASPSKSPPGKRSSSKSKKGKKSSKSGKKK